MFPSIISIINNHVMIMFHIVDQVFVKQPGDQVLYGVKDEPLTVPCVTSVKADMVKWYKEDTTHDGVTNWKLLASNNMVVSEYKGQKISFANTTMV